MNYLAGVSGLRNHYFALRHGQSRANVAKLIVSKPENGLNDFGLTKKGREQAENSVKQARFLGKDTVIYSSDFKRARETAGIAKRILGCGKVILSKDLRERFFGDWEKQGAENYTKIWEADLLDADGKHGNVESLNEVQSRVSFFVCEVDKKYEDRNILLVSHGDTLQILETCFLKKSASDMRIIDTAEIRKLELSV